MAIKHYLNHPVHLAPLVTFRMGLGLLVLVAMLRFWANGWIESLYLQPDFHFHYQGFEWVQVPPPVVTYGLFAICGLAGLAVAAGWHYRAAIVVLFLSFTYIELMDKTTYLNHYYFVSVAAFLLLWLPAHRWASLDVKRKPALRQEWIARYWLGSLRLLVGLVYVYAGLAKLNSDWLLQAMPLKIWLMSKYELPLLGDWLQQEWTHYAFSWAGAAFDLSVPFLLLWRPTRWIAYGAVVVFHLLTWWLFPIGIFPFVMMIAATVFFPSTWHRDFWVGLGMARSLEARPTSPTRPLLVGWRSSLVAILLLVQLLFPWRYAMRPGELFWTEDGYRFSWRVMLMEKAGYAQFRVVDPDTGRRFYVDNSDFLTTFQEKQMATQVDFILEYAHHLDAHYRAGGIRDPQLYVESYVALNGRRSQPYVDPDLDLSELPIWTSPHRLLLPFNDRIYGL